jgi:hypothetical protein
MHNEKAGVLVNRFLTSAVLISNVLALAAVAGGDDDRRHQGNHKNHGHHGHHGHQGHQGWGSWGGFADFFSDHKKHHGHHHPPKKDPIPIDPGKGDGPIADPIRPTPPVVPAPRPGFVWVGDHWERVKAPAKTVNPYPANVVVRDHRTPAGSFPAGTIVRDHRTPTGASGGVTVTVVNPTSTKGPVVRDHRTTPVVRDHRTLGK